VSEQGFEAAREFEALFQQVYLRFHRRDGKRSGLSGASRAVLLHLSMTGPVTVGEAAAHLDRAQSVVSEIVSQLESKALLERESDPDDRRRTLVWLTPSGREALRRDGEVLDPERLLSAMQGMDDDHCASLVTAMRALVAADSALVPQIQTTPTKGRQP
jgi:DNA-binding MarR family transcriptional regulator